MEKIRLLHLSDIHFGQNGKIEDLDLDDELRNELQLDLENLVESLGSISAVLIGGDIAFSGKENEYAIAEKWISKVCKIAACPEENVLTIPGNHDIDRNAITATHYDVHTTFKSLKTRIEIDQKLKAYESDNQSSFLLAPLENYHRFALRYKTVPKNNRHFWEKDFKLGESVIRVRGMNSAIFSNQYDDENISKLLLSSFQTNVKRENGIIHIALCHHPPKWLIDENDIQKELRNRYRIQLFGHEHSHDTVKMDESIVVYSGALHPDRRENGWEPRYNVIELSIEGSRTPKLLDAKIYARVWDKTNRQFIAHHQINGSDFMSRSIQLSDVESRPFRMNKVHENQTSTAIIDSIETIEVNKENPKRKLAFQYFKLPFGIREDIAKKIGVHEPPSYAESEISKAQKYFLNADAANKYDLLWEEVSKHYPENRTINNPFIS